MPSYHVSTIYGPDLEINLEAADEADAQAAAIKQWEATGKLDPYAHRPVFFAVEEYEMYVEMKARGWIVQHMGGGCLAYELEMANGAKLYLTCRDGGDLPLGLDKDALLGVGTESGTVLDAYSDEGGTIGEGTTRAMLDLADAKRIAAKWVAKIGIGFHPDTRGADYGLTGEAAECDRDMETLFALPGDPYAHVLEAMKASGLDV